MMKNALTVFAVILSTFMFVAVSIAANIEPVQLGIMTGGQKGTYYQFGLNLEQLAKQHGVGLNVYNSAGSVENIYAVFQRPMTQMGIVQSDVLAFVSKIQTDPVLKRIAKKIKMVYPLYNEEVHLLGKREIKSFDDLAGKRVAIGQEGSGTYLTAKLLFEVSGIKPAETLPVSSDEALPMVKEGKIDALFYVAGYPVKLFSEQVAKSDPLALIPIQNSAITEFYPIADIPAGTYAWQPQEVHSIAVKSVLISFDFKMANCEHIGKFAQTLAENLDWLKTNGHPKWNSVDLEYPLKGWEQYSCVQKYHSKKPAVARQQQQEINPVLQAIKDTL